MEWTSEQVYQWYFSFVCGLPILALVIAVIRSVKIVEKGTAMVVERWGKFHRCAAEGIYLLIPIMDAPHTLKWRESEPHFNTYRYKQRTLDRIDLRESIIDFPNQPIITRDNVEIMVHPMVLYRLVNPMRVCYETFDLSHAVEKLVQTTLRSIIGDMGLDDTLASREEINRNLMQRVSNICNNWGIEITRVELLEIFPSRSVQNAMHKQLAAERIRRADIVTADGYREQIKTMAEGAMQAEVARASGESRVSVLQAKGLADARRLIAEAEATSVSAITEALSEFGVNATDYLIGLHYIETFTQVAMNATDRTVFFPTETNIMGAVGGIRG